jgi:hypothetical protein
MQAGAQRRLASLFLCLVQQVAERREQTGASHRVPQMSDALARQERAQPASQQLQGLAVAERPDARLVLSLLESEQSLLVPREAL